MQKFEYCKPLNAKAVPTGPDWIHEVKYDGYRGRIVREARTSSCYRRAGWIGLGAFRGSSSRKIKQSQFIIDGEICVLDVQGISDFNTLHSNRNNEEAQLYAFDLMSIDGEDLRDVRCSIAKAS